MSEVRVRFAPSPTGYLHVGGARSALFNYLYAKNKGGKFLLRIEDTDQERSTEEALKMQVSDLKWLGLKWDEGYEVEGPFGPYKQSERLGIYADHAGQLLNSGKAYYCFCTDEVLEQKKQKAQAEGRPPQYDGTCRNVTLSEAKDRLGKGEKAVVRFKIQNKKDYILNDIVRGEVNFPSDMVGDFVVLRSDGMPVYNFCCVIDDHLMKITHVFRAEEHLSNTVRQMMLYESYGWSLPEFGHISLILGSDRQKLSKRHGATSCHEYMERGFLPEALNNYLVLLGWSSPNGEEVLTMDQMISLFTTDRMNPAPAVFDEVKLKWFNAHYLRALPHDELFKKITPFLDEAGIHVYAEKDWQERAVSLLKTSMETLKDAVELFRPLSDAAFRISEESQETLSWESTAAVVKKWRELVSGLSTEFMTPEQFESFQNQIKETCAVKGKNLFMPIRVSVIGQPHGAEMKLLAPLLKKSSLISRATTVLERLQK